MKNRYLLLICIICCSPVQNVQAQLTKAQLSASLAQTIITLETAVNSFDSTTIFSLTDSSAVSIDIFNDPIVGLDAQKQDDRKLFKQFSFYKAHFSSEKTEVSDVDVFGFRYGYDKGTVAATFTNKATGKTSLIAEKYFRLWKYKNNKWVLYTESYCPLWYKQ
jgi:hypothetical protein